MPHTPRTPLSSPRLPSRPVPFSAPASPSQAGGGHNFAWPGSAQNKIDEHIRRNAAGLLGIISRSSLTEASNPRAGEDAKSSGRVSENGQHQSAASSLPIWWNPAVETKANNFVNMLTFHGKAGAAVEALDGVNHTLQQTLMVLQSRMAELTAKADASKNGWGSLQDAVRDNVLLAKQVDTLKRERNGLERENMLLEEAANKLSGAAARSQLEINRLMAQVKTLEGGQGRGGEADVQDLKDQVLELQIVCKNKDNDLRSSHSRIQELEKNLSEQQSKVRSMVQDLIQGQSVYATVETRAVKLEARVAELEKGKQQASTDLEKLVKQYDEAKKKLGQAVEKIAQHERERAEEAAKAEEVVYALKKSVYRLKQRSENGSVMSLDSPAKSLGRGGEASPTKSLERGREESPTKSLGRGGEADDARSSPRPRQQVDMQTEVQDLHVSAAASSQNASEGRDTAILQEMTNELKVLRSQMDAITKEREMSPAHASAAPSDHVSASSEPSKIVFSSQWAAPAPADSRDFGGAGESASECVRGGDETTRPAAVKKLDLSSITSQRATESNTASGALTPRGKLPDSRYDPPTGSASAREGYQLSQSSSRGDEPRARPDDFSQRKSYSASNTPRAYDTTPSQRFELDSSRGSPKHGPAPEYPFKTGQSASRSPRQVDAQSEATRAATHSQRESSFSPRGEPSRSEQKMMTLSESLAESWINLVSPRPTASYTPPNQSPVTPAGAALADQHRYGSAHDRIDAGRPPQQSPRYPYSNSSQYTHDYSSSNGTRPMHINHQPQQMRVGGDYHQEYDSSRGVANNSPYASTSSHYQSTIVSPRGVDRRQHGAPGGANNSQYQSTYGEPRGANNSQYQSATVSPRGVDYRQYGAPGGSSDGLTYSVVATPRTGTPVNGVYSPRGGGGAISSPRGRELTVGGQPIVSARAGRSISSPRGGGSPRTVLDSNTEYMF